jgi:FAD:protein FMN transferase
VPATVAARPARPITAVPPAVPEMVGRPFTVFGTFASLFVTRPAALDRAYQVLAAQLLAMNKACSRFRPDSELSAVNRAGGQEIAITPLFSQALAAALRAAEATEGDVDPTCGGSLVRLGYDRDFARLADNQAALSLPAVPAPGWRRIQLDSGRLTLRVPAGVRLDLGATGKAFAADLGAAEVFAATGAGVLVNLGGDIAVAGPPPAAGWRIRIVDGLAGTSGGTAGGGDPVIAIWDGGLATSSPLGRRWRRGGQQMHHIVVPATGRPAVSRWACASVAAGSCVDANSASTAAIIRSDRAPAWLASLGLPARLAAADGTVVTTGGWPT